MELALEFCGNKLTLLVKLRKEYLEGATLTYFGSRDLNISGDVTEKSKSGRLLSYYQM